MTLPQMNIRYLYDPTGKSRDNLVVGEKHTIPPLHNRVIVPKLGAFYAKSLVVRNDSRIFELFKDYELTMLYHDATVETGQDVNVGIAFTNLDIVGDVSIQYQVVGGEFTGVWESVQQYVNTLLVDPRKVRWDDVLNKPELYAPMEHYHDINDVYGLNNLIPKLEEIRRAIMHIRSKEMRNVYDKIIQIRGQVEKSINDFNNGLVDRIKELMGENDSLEVVKKQIRNLNDNIQNLLDDDSVKDAIKTLNAKDIDLSNSITNLTDTKANKEYVDEKYQSNLDRINALNNVLPSIKNDINSKADKVDVDKKYRDNLAKINALDNTVIPAIRNDINGKADKVEMATKLAELTNTKADKTTVDASLATMKKLLDSMEEEVSNVMSCSSIGRLPAKSWVNGSSVLARTPTGECYRLMTDDNFFQDLGVAFSADRTVKEEGQTFNVKCIVTNSGVSKNEVTTLVINPPNQNEKTAYSVTDFNASTQGAERFERINNFTYKIYGLGKGSTFTLEFKVVPAKYGTFQFGASVTVDGKWDTDDRNNSASIILSSTTKIDPNYVASVDCPRIIATGVSAPGTVYKAIPTNGNDFIISKPMSDQDYLNVMSNFNIIDTHNNSGLRGFKVKLENASSIVVRGSGDVFYQYNIWYKLINGKLKYHTHISGKKDISSVNNLTSYDTTFKDWSFDSSTSILTIESDTPAIYVLCKPKGSNCNWQGFYFVASKNVVGDIIPPTTSTTFEGLPSNARISETIIPGGGRYASWQVLNKDGEVYFLFTGINDTINRLEYAMGDGIIFKKVLTLPKNKAYSFKIYSNDESILNKIAGNLNTNPIDRGDKFIPKDKRYVLEVTTTNKVSQSDNITIDRKNLIRLEFSDK